METQVDWLKNYTTAFDPSGPAAAATVNVLLSTGTHLFFVIATLYLSFLSLKMMLEDDGPIGQIGTLINGLLTSGLIYSGLLFYPNLLGWINEGFSQVSSIIAGGAGPTDLVWLGFKKIMAQAIVVYESIPPMPEISLNDIFDLSNSSNMLMVWAMDILVSMLAILALVGAAVMYMLIYSYSLLLFMVGAIVGPIMLPWYLLGPFKFVAEGWLKFMITAGFYRVVAMACIAVLSPFLTQMNSEISRQAEIFGSTNDPALQTYHLFFSVSVLVFSVGILYMLSKVPDITNSLLSGHGTGGALNLGGGGLKLGGKKPSEPPKPPPPDSPPATARSRG